MSKVLQSQNLCFFPLSPGNNFIPKELTSPKYMAGTLYGGVMTDEIYTLEEIKRKWPDIIEVELTSNFDKLSRA